MHALVFAVLLTLGNAQSNFLYYALGTGTSCVGSGEIHSDGLDVLVNYDATPAYKEDGWTELKKSSGRYYRFTMCGDLANSTCSGDWCFEEVNATNKDQCMEALARWQENDNTTITYSVIYNETINEETNTTGPDKPIGLHIQIADHNQIRKSCPNKESFINYNILCSQSSTTTQYRSLYENYTSCVWNVSLASPYGCVIETSLETNIPTPMPTEPIIIDSHNHNKLSTGSVLVIILVVVILTYLILGCAYNSFYHGRVGMEAIPNKNGWSQLWRYFKAGCETTYDTLCCHQGNVDYQNL